MPENGATQQARPRLVAGRYLLLNELGRGGMGTVWLADDQLIARRVAVKELRPPQGLPAEREVFARRALSEANSAARIHHPGAVTLFDVIPGTAADDAVYLIMEYVEGPTLAQLIRSQGPLPDAVAAGYGLRLLDVLDAAHALGVVHRDVKPANIIITPAGQAKLTDFGIAHIAGDARLTRSGVMGTQAYMAPELFESAPITPAADLWALGATLYAASHGHGPFDHDTTAATLRAILIDPIPAPRCGPALATAITSLLQRDPARRATIEAARAWLGHAVSTGLAATGPAVPPARTAPTAPAPPHPSQPTGSQPTGSQGTGSQRVFGQATGDRATGGQRVFGQPPTWEQAPTTRAPAQPLILAPAPLAPTQPARARVRRSRLIIGLAAAVITIAVGTTAGFLATGSGSAGRGTVLATLRGESSGEIESVSFRPDGRTVVTSDPGSGRAWVWSTATGQQVASLPASTIDSPVAVSPDGSTLAYGTTVSERVDLWNVARGSVSGVLPSPGSSSSVGILAFSPDGQTLAAGDRLNPQVYLYNVASRTLTATLTDPEQPFLPGGPGAIGSEVDSLAFSPNGKLLAAVDDYSGSIFVWDLASRKAIATLTLPDLSLLACTNNCPTYDSHIPGWVAFSPDSGTLAIADQSRGIQLWNVATRSWASPLPTNDVHVQDAIAFSPDGKTLAAGDQYGSITLWNVASRSLITTLTEPGNEEVTAIAFSPDGRTLVTGDKGGQAYLWNVAGYD